MSATTEVAALVSLHHLRDCQNVKTAASFTG